MVERRTENPGVSGPIPLLGTLIPVFNDKKRSSDLNSLAKRKFAGVAQLVEQCFRKARVGGSTPLAS